MTAPQAANAVLKHELGRLWPLRRCHGVHAEALSTLCTLQLHVWLPLGYVSATAEALRLGVLSIPKKVALGKLHWRVCACCMQQLLLCPSTRACS